jgi:hypothetical protein
MGYGNWWSRFFASDVGNLAVNAFDTKAAAVSRRCGSTTAWRTKGAAESGNPADFSPLSLSRTRANHRVVFAFDDVEIRLWV